MRRDLRALAERELDLVIVGGGVYGAAAAWDAASRGLSVALVEREDFGAATSFNSLKTIHGGLRYLQHADFRRMRESVRERRALMRIAPHLVHPQPFLMPTYKGDPKRSRIGLGLALFLNDLVGFDRNRLDDPEKFLPRGRIVSREECLRLAPGVDEEDMTGGAIWYDAQMYNSDRVTLSFVLSAAKAGAQVANHLEVTGFLTEGSRVTGVRARDRLGEEELDIRGRVVLNTSGPWVDRLLFLLDGRPRPPLFHYSKGLNLVTRPLLERVALGVRARRCRENTDAVIPNEGPFLFLVPWRSSCLVGTTHALFEGSPEGWEATEEEIQELLDDVNRSYPAAGLQRDDVRLVHRGLLPRVPARAKESTVTLEKKYRIQDHRSEGVEGLISVVGVKYTTARDVAERAVNQVFAQFGKKGPRSRTAVTPLHGGHIERFGSFLEDALRESSGGLNEETTRHLAHTYGSSYPEVLAYFDENPSWGKRVTPGSPVLRAEIVHAVREEMAFTLASVILRRTELGSAGHPGRSCLEACADIMAGELGWSPTMVRDEIESLEVFYRRRS